MGARCQPCASPATRGLKMAFMICSESGSFSSTLNDSWPNSLAPMLSAWTIAPRSSTLRRCLCTFMRRAVCVVAFRLVLRVRESSAAELTAACAASATRCGISTPPGLAWSLPGTEVSRATACTVTMQLSVSKSRARLVLVLAIVPGCWMANSLPFFCACSLARSAASSAASGDTSPPPGAPCGCPLAPFTAPLALLEAEPLTAAALWSCLASL
mmetsp:Transcript_16712/g.42856  ORF Transcript_16712/g.42856 Transcript_16712/m.42856 type:complete len:214 (+) Transcript_16712:795-1436(+)